MLKNVDVGRSVGPFSVLASSVILPIMSFFIRGQILSIPKGIKEMYLSFSLRFPCNFLRCGANQDQGPESIEGICHILVYLYILGGFLTNYYYFDTNSSKSI